MSAYCPVIIYALMPDGSDLPSYVGQTVNMSARLKAHEWTGPVKVLEVVGKDDATATEKRWIEHYAGLGAPLRNNRLMPPVTPSPVVAGTDPDLLTVQEAALRAGVGETAIRNALLRGRLAFEVRYGRKLIRAADLAQYQAQAKPGRPKKAGPPPPSTPEGVAA